MSKKQLTAAEVIANLKSCRTEISQRSFVDNNKAQISALLIEHTPSATTPEAIAAVFKARNCIISSIVAQKISDNLAQYKERSSRTAFAH